MKFYLSILLCLVCLSCANQADQYIIRGSFPGLQDGMTVRLLNAETRNKDEQLLAADTVKNGAGNVPSLDQQQGHRQQ